MTDPEIDWGEDAPKARSWESDEARRLRQAKHAREMEFQAELAASRRRRLLIGLPLTLLLLGGATAVGLDFTGVLPLGLFRHEPPPAPIVAAEPAPVTPAAAPVPMAEPMAYVPAPAPEPEPVAQLIPDAVEPVAVPQVDQGEVNRIQNRIGHLKEGVRVLSNDQLQLRQEIYDADMQIYGTWDGNGHRRQDGAVHRLARAQTLMAQATAAPARFTGRNVIDNIQGQINTWNITIGHDTDVLRSTNERLAKAQAELAAARASLPR